MTTAKATKAPLKKAGATKAPAAAPASKAATTKAAKPAAVKPTKKGGKRDDTPKATAPGAAKPQEPIALANGFTVHPLAIRAALRVYAPGTIAPESDAETFELLKTAIAARAAEVGPEHHLLCGEPDDEKTGCRGVATTDIKDYCPFCGDDFKAEEHAPAEIVGTTATGLEAQRHELEEVVAQFRTYSRDLVGNCYDIGVVLRQINERELWKAAGSDSFKQFIEKELGMSRTSAYRYMSLTEQYDRATFLEVGPKKLELISGMPSDQREAALEEARNGASARELASGADSEGSSRGEAPARERRDSSAPPPKKANEITLIGKVGGKAEVVQWRSGDSTRPIKTWKPGAYAEHYISDDVVVRIMLKEVKGEPGTFEACTVALVRAK